MDPFEKHLRGDIPLEAAADFFLKLKYGSAGPRAREMSVLTTRMKKANAAMGYGAVPNAGAPPPAPVMPAPAPVSLPATAMGKHAKSLRKIAEGMFGEGMASPGSVAPQVDMSQYSAMEEQGLEAEQENQAEFLRQKLEEAKAELQAAQDQAQQAQMTAQQLQVQQSQHDQQLQAAQQSAQLATQAAMQNVEQANAMAMQATSSALQAKDDAINTHSLAAKMRMSYQDLRGQIMDAVAQDAAAPVGEAIKAQGALGAGPAAPLGQDPMAAGGDPNAPPQDPNAPAQDPNAQQAPPQGAPPGGQEAGGPPAEAAPPEEEEPAGPPAEPAAPKEAGVMGSLAGMAGQFLKERAPHAAAGAAIGGGLTALESQMGNQGLHDDIEQLEGQPEGFGKALRMAAAKMKLSLNEATKQYPAAATAAGALAGAGAGMSLGPSLVDGMAKLPSNIRELRRK